MLQTSPGESVAAPVARHASTAMIFLATSWKLILEPVRQRVDHERSGHDDRAAPARLEVESRAHAPAEQKDREATVEGAPPLNENAREARGR
jgi:hypothetical protein